MNKYGFRPESLSSLVPSILRKNRLTSFLQVLLVPVKHIYDKFMSFKKDKDYRLEHSGQVLSLQNMIREYCKDERCYITDGLYLEDVEVPYNGTDSFANYQIHIPYDGNMEPEIYVMYCGSENAVQSDFVVHLPEELQDIIDKTGLFNLIDGYKLAGKFYSIVYEQM